MTVTGHQLKLQAIKEYLRASGWTGADDRWIAPAALRSAIQIAFGGTGAEAYHMPQAIKMQVQTDMYLVKFEQVLDKLKPRLEKAKQVGKMKYRDYRIIRNDLGFWCVFQPGARHHNEEFEDIQDAIICVEKELE